MKSWTQRRLENLFQKYNRQYFGGRLKNWGVAIQEFNNGLMGYCDDVHQQLCVSVDKIRDREIHSTLLHEMAHAAAGTQDGHGYKFWEQIEHLLRQKAPITLDFPEAPNSNTFEGIIPKRFKLCCAALKKLEAQRVRALDKEAKEKNLQTVVVTDEAIIASFIEAGYELTTASESEIVTAVAKRYDLFDVGSKPKNRWAARIIAEGKKAYRKAKREEDEEFIGIEVR